MKKKIILLSIIILSMIMWTCRYLYVNHGNFLAHPSYEIQATQEYHINDTIEIGENSSYYNTILNGCIVTVNSTRLLDLEDFCNEHIKSIDDFSYPMDRYLEVDLTIENISSTEESISLVGLIIRGIDWSTVYMNDATIFANNDDLKIEDTSVFLQQGESLSIKLEYGLNKSNFRKSRWNDFTNEEIWLILTHSPEEKKVKIYL